MRNYPPLVLQFRVSILVFIVLSACRQSGAPLRIVDASISPKPVVGKVVTLNIEVVSTRDEPNVTIDVILPDEINLVAGELVWHGSLVTNQSQIHELSICVLRPGDDWRIGIGTKSLLSETSSYGDGELLHIESSVDSARVFSSADYEVTESEYSDIWPYKVTVTPTPDSPTVSVECSGVQK